MIRGFPPLLTALFFLLVWVLTYAVLRYVAPELKKNQVRAIATSLAVAVTALVVVGAMFALIALVG